ncbi:MAG: AMP-binding protein [Crocinitomicaceae bacterium]|nr:AMP-binding protein [Crocinitomicaceae bacterium]
MFKDIVFTEGVEDSFKESVFRFIREWDSYSMEIELKTSGTTGAPKSFKFNKKQLEASAKMTGRFFDFKPGESLLLNLSPDYVAGKLMIVRAIVHDMKLVVAPLKSDPFTEIKELPCRIKLAAFVPVQIHEIFSNENSLRIFNQIENVLIGGGVLSKNLEEKIAIQNPKSFASFGMTETLTHFAIRPVDGKTDYYTYLPGVEISVNENNCICIHPNEIVREKIISHDIVELLGKNSFRWLGRSDNLINSGGIKIQPEVIEQKIVHLIQSPFYVTSKKDDRLGEKVVLILESDQKPDHDLELLQKLKEQLPEYHAIAEIICVNKIERTDNGKMIRRKF